MFVLYALCLAGRETCTGRKSTWIHVHHATAPHHAALPHLVSGAGRADDPFREAIEERPAVLVLLLRPAVGCVPRRHHGVLEVQVAAVSTDLSS